jgi:rhamnosyltransferase
MLTLPDLVARVRAQDLPAELVALDSGSTDGSREFLQRRADVFVEVPAGEFDHGLTRNLGIERSSGDLVVLMAQDALPADTRWLSELTRPFADAAVAGASARQLPLPGASAVTRLALARWHAAGSTPRRVRFESAAQFDALPPLQKLAACIVDDVCSCVRRSAWLHHPFRKAGIAEDLIWAREVLRAGHALAFAAAAAVFHSHERGPLYELKRTLLLHRQLQSVFGVRTLPGPSGTLRAVLSQLLAHAQALAAEPPPRIGRTREIARALGLAVAWPLGQYLGGLAGARGAGPDKVEGV